MNPNEMTIEQIGARLTEIRTASMRQEISLEELEKLSKEAEQLRAAQGDMERRDTLRRSIAAGKEGTVVRTMQDMDGKATRRTYDNASPEYRTAWLKNIAVRAAPGSHEGVPMFGEMTEEERRAFTFTTANSGSLVPKVIADRIVELVRSQYPIYTDATKSFMEMGFGVPRHKSIDAGDAAETAEGAAGTDEQDSFDLLDLTGVEIKKVVELSRKMKFQSIDAFESWLVDHIAKRIGVAKEKHIITKLDDTSGAGMAAGNVLTGTLSDEEIRKIFSQIDQDGNKVVYANAKTIWNVIAGLENAKGEKLFIPSTMDDPMVEGRIYGAKVKPDANLADNVIYVGVPASILANEFSELEIFEHLEAKTAKTIYTGYSLFDAGLENPLAFVKYTHTPAA